MKINRKTLYIAALGYLWMGGTETILAQDATADSVKTGFFNAMDYVRQKRYIPAGRVIDPKVHIPADTRSAFPVISVQSPVSIQCCWQS